MDTSSLPDELRPPCPRGCADVQGCGCEWNERREQESIGYWVKTTDRLARRVDELEAALEVLARWPPEKTRFEAERFAKEALRRSLLPRSNVSSAATCSRCGYPRTRTACARCLYVELGDRDPRYDDMDEPVYKDGQRV